MRKNPFSIYDFLGYIFPGALVLCIGYVFMELQSYECSEGLYCCVKDIIGNLYTRTTFSFENTIFMTVVSYVIGHFVAYLSSLTVEKFSIWAYGFPSDFLLEYSNHSYFNVVTSREGEPHKRMLVWRVIVALVLLPLSICSMLFSELLGVKYLFLKTLDDDLVRNINAKSLELAHYLGYETNGAETDFFRVIYHYEYELQKTHVCKMDNYVALYGFMRAITFIFCSTFMFVLAFMLVRWYFDWELFGLLLSLMFVAYIFFMGFMKFYRRFTLEGFMCLIIDTSYKSANDKKDASDESSSTEITIKHHTVSKH